MDFFDDEATGPNRPAQTQPPRRRRPGARRRTRIQRLVVLAIILFLLVFAIAWWARSCQHARKVDAYRTYFEGVSAAIHDSDTLGRQLNKFVENPTKLQRQQLIASLDRWATGQQEIAVRAARLNAPAPLADEQHEFAAGMKVRARGYALLRDAILAALGKKNADAAKLAALDGYFSGPDAYYMDLAYMQSRQTLADQGVSDVTVPTSTYYLTANIFDPTRIESALKRMSSSAKLTGIHGVALKGVDAVSAGKTVKLVAGSTVTVPASAGLAFTVKVQNQGNVTETKVPVQVVLVLPNKSTLKQTATITTIAAGQTQNVSVSGFSIPTNALSKVITLKAKAGPVPQERVKSNNSRQYKFLLQLT